MTMGNKPLKYAFYSFWGPNSFQSVTGFFWYRSMQMNFGGKKKPRATPANVEWNSVERLWYTTGGSMDGVIPPEFEDLDARLKEMQNFLAILCKLSKKQQKYLTSILYGYPFSLCRPQHFRFIGCFAPYWNGQQQQRVGIVLYVHTFQIWLKSVHPSKYGRLSNVLRSSKNGNSLSLVL